ESPRDKYVVFAVDHDACQALARRLTGLPDVVVAHSQLPTEQTRAAVEAFRGRPALRFLLADEKLEEGHNLQHAQGVVFADLAHNPMRLEQQIGRLDRLGRLGDVRCVPLISHPDAALALDEAWLHVVRDGCELFDESAADVAFVLNTEMGRLQLAALEHGPAGLLREIDAVKQRIEQERGQNDEQDAIDGLDLTQPETAARWKALQA